MCTKHKPTSVGRRKSFFGGSATPADLDFKSQADHTLGNTKEDFSDRNTFKRYKIDENAKKKQKMETADFEQAER